MTTLADITTRCPEYMGSDHGEVSTPEWLIGPVGRSRDSDLIEESNWDVVTDRLHEIDPEGRDYEIHRFGHWAVGWIEEIAYRPGSAVAAYADETRKRLDSYPILDSDHHSRLECEAVDESWESWQARDVRREIVRELVSRIDPESPDDMSADEIEEWIDTVSDDRLWELVRECEISDGCLRVSRHDIEAAATKLVEASDSDEGTEVSTTD